MSGKRAVAIHYDKYGVLWRDLLSQRISGFDVRLWPDWGDLDDIDYAVAWTPPHGLLRQCTNLKGVFSIGAGVDQLLVLVRRDAEQQMMEGALGRVTAQRFGLSDRPIGR